ncbi:hypothetical protein CEXT_401751 [Caerostris extrusa]|uniref:Uncharacterized protein n=1 Tax=Caerostris extrusa TaxID=172846 RepID=A0AAV4NT44_CAEEX|nr:hypothetical protein CEXT_401751 [Caerostris extrusa]
MLVFSMAEQSTLPAYLMRPILSPESGETIYLELCPRGGQLKLGFGLLKALFTQGGISVISHDLFDSCSKEGERRIKVISLSEGELAPLLMQ